MRSSNLYFAPSSTPGMKSSQIPDEPSERIGCRRPSHELKSPTTATDARVRRPDRERGAGDAVDLADVRAEPLVERLVAALHREVEVELAERREERVRVAERERLAVGVLDLELVLERQASPSGQQRLPEPAAGS